MLFANELPLPALPAMAEALHTSANNAQYTVASNLTGIAIFALFHGPLADAYGRKNVLLISLAFYVVISLMCPLAHNINDLIIFRFLQGCAGGSTTVLGLVMVNDMFTGSKNTQVLSKVVLATVLSRLIAPVIGGYLTQHYGWEYVFIAMAFYSALLWLLLLLFYHETYHPPTTTLSPQRTFRAHLHARFHQTAQGFADMLQHRPFMYAVAIHSSHFMGKWVYGTIAPFIFIKTLGISTVAYGYYSAAIIIVFIVCSIYTQRLVERIGNFAIIEHGLLISLFGTVLLFILALYFPNHPVLITIGAGLYIGTTAMMGPAGATLAMDCTVHKGSAASIVSSSRTFVGVAGSLVGGLVQDSNLIIVPIIFLCTIIIPAFMLKRLKEMHSESSA